MKPNLHFQVLISSGITNTRGPIRVRVQDAVNNSLGFNQALRGIVASLYFTAHAAVRGCNWKARGDKSCFLLVVGLGFTKVFWVDRRGVLVGKVCMEFCI